MHSILDVAAALDPPLTFLEESLHFYFVSISEFILSYRRN